MQSISAMQRKSWEYSCLLRYLGTLFKTLVLSSQFLDRQRELVQEQSEAAKLPTSKPLEGLYVGARMKTHFG